MNAETQQQLELLGLQAQFLTDLEQLRIANGNRLWSLSDRFGLDEGHPACDSAGNAKAALELLEAQVEKDLVRALRETEFHAIIKGMMGVGFKQGARLLAVIGHPRWRWSVDDEAWLPRTVGQLWSYCGYAPVLADGHTASEIHSVAAVRVSAKRKRGEQAAYNSEARTKAFLVAESCIKQRHSPYRAVYDDRRARTVEKAHDAPCVRCGPKGKPAQIGSAWSLGHQHADGLRIVAKQVLKDLWIKAGEGEATGLAESREQPPRLPRRLAELVA